MSEILTEAVERINAETSEAEWQKRWYNDGGNWEQRWERSYS